MSDALYKQIACSNKFDELSELCRDIRISHDSKSFRILIFRYYGIELYTVSYYVKTGDLGEWDSFNCADVHESSEELAITRGLNWLRQSLKMSYPGEE